MLTRLAILLAAGLSLSPSAHADRFYFGSAETEKQIAEGTADYIDGVLVDADEGVFTIRVVGGVIVIEEARIYKIERDMLTVKAIQSQEQDNANKLARANAKRRAMQAERAQLARERARLRQQQVEAEAEAAQWAEQAESFPAEESSDSYNPVLGRVDRR